MSRAAEILLVNLLCFGPFAARSIIGLVERNETLTYDNRGALTTIAIELVCGALAVLLLRARGWKLSDFGLRPTLMRTAGGMLLLIGTSIVVGGIYELARAATGVNLAAVTASKMSVGLPVLLLLTLINPLYDEQFAVAYNVEAAKENGAAFAVTLSAMVRLICHLEHGPIAAVTILPMGLLFAIVYWRWRTVWPLVIAHAVMDFQGMLQQ